MSRGGTFPTRSQRRTTAWRLPAVILAVITLVFSALAGTGIAVAAGENEENLSTPTNEVSETSSADVSEAPQPDVNSGSESAPDAESGASAPETSTQPVDTPSADQGTGSDAEEATTEAAPSATEEPVAPGCWVDLVTGDDTAAGTQAAPYKTIAQALKTSPACATIYLQGTGTTTPVTIPGGTTLELSGDATLAGTGSGTAITLASGATLKAGAHTLTVSNYAVALVVQQGATVVDGHYDLAKKLTLAGTVEGTSREALSLKVTGEYDAKGTSHIERATVNVYGVNGYRSPHLIAEDVSYTFDNIYLVPFAVDLNNSDLLVKGRYLVSWRGGKSLSFLEGPNEIKRVRNSTVIVDGSRVYVALPKVTFENSTLEIRNSPDGGINVNYGGGIFFKDSVVKGTNVTGYPLIGVGLNGTSEAHFEGNSRVETAASSNYDRVGTNDDSSAYTVLGGSYHVYTGSITGTNDRPTNGADHGNEKLTYFQLADPSVALLDVIDKNGEHYTYPVATANEDGNKYVWVPAATITYELRDASATFSDGTKAAKKVQAMRGQTFNAASKVNGKEQTLPADPTAANGKTFAGWKYTADDGTEKAYDPATTVISKDTTVYATWEGDATSAVVAYANGADDPEPTTLSYPEGETVKVASYEEVLQQNPKFTKEGYHFDYWARDAAGKDRVKVGSELDVSTGSPVLYAVWAIDTYEVRFSANGGTFAPDSVFKADATKDAFTITKEANGGEVATLKEPIAWNTTLADVFKKVGVSEKDITGQVSRQFFEPRYQKVCVSGFCWGSWGTYEDQHPWYTTAAASDSDRAKTTDKVTSDLTLYAGWTLQTNVEKLEMTNLSLPGDLAIQGGRPGTPVPLVFKGDILSIKGYLDVEPIKEQITALGQQFTESGGNEEDINLSGVASTFTASFTLPEGMSVPEGNVEGAKLTENPLFEVTSATSDGANVTVTMALKEAYDHFVDLKNDVTGVTGAGEPLVLTVPGVNVTKEIASGSTVDLTVIGNVSGDFEGIASVQATEARDASVGSQPRYILAATTTKAKYFHFTWNATQDTNGTLGNGSDPLAGGDTATIRDTVRLVAPSQFTNTMGVPGNITVNGEDSAIVEVRPGESVTWLGELGMKPVKDQIKQLAQSYCDTDSSTAWGNSDEPSEACRKELETINLENIASQFTATFTLPEGITPQAGLAADDVKFTSNGLFHVSKVEQNDQTVTITMELNKAGENGYTKFTDLFDDVWITSEERTPAVLQVTVPSTVDSDAPTNSNLTAYGEVAGTFTGIAWKPSGIMREFNFTWNAVQTEGFGQKDEAGVDGITGTVYIVEPTLLKNHDLTIPGDLTITTAGAQDTTTQADAVRTVARGADYVYTGTISTQGIKDQISALAANYCGTTGDLNSTECQEKLAKISLSDVSSTFTATITLPAGITAKSGLTADDVNFTSNGTFRVDGVKQHDNDVTITMSLVKDYTTFIELFTDIVTSDAAHTPTQLTVDVPATVDTDAKVNTNLTADGTVTGAFYAQARSGREARTYDFAWTATQAPEGLDSTLASASADEKKAITLTVEAAARTINVKKEWKLEGAFAGVDTPDAVITLKADGKAVGKPLTLNAGNKYAGSFENVNTYQADGKTEVAYTVEETPIANVTTQVTGDTTQGFTVTNTPNAPTPVTLPTQPLDGDLQINTHGSDDATTQHEAIRYISTEGSYDFTGTIATEQIKQQITMLAGQYCGANITTECTNKIALTDVASQFKAVLTFPEGLTVPADLTTEAVAKTFNGGDLFHVSDVAVDGQKVTITMELNKAYTSFTALYKDVTGVADTLTVSVHGVTITPEATKAGTALTTVGEVTGAFHGTARVGFEARTYDFTWKAAQTDAGRDSTRVNATGADAAAITLTVQSGVKNVNVTKVWEANELIKVLAGTDYPQVSVQLLAAAEDADAEAVDGETIALNAEGNWAGTFTDLPAYTPEGKALTYSVKEAKLDGYSSSVTGTETEGYTITNTPQTTTVNVEKAWEGIDASDAPEVLVKLLADGEATDMSRALNTENGWKGSFEQLPATKADGTTPIKYTVEEEALEGYTSKVTGNAADGFLVTNTKNPDQPDNPDQPTNPGQPGGTTTTPDKGGKLPLTGMQAGALGGFALLALIAGGVSVVVARRKK